MNHVHVVVEKNIRNVDGIKHFVDGFHEGDWERD